MPEIRAHLTAAEVLALQIHAQRSLAREAIVQKNDFWEFAKFLQTRREDTGKVEPFPRWEFLQRAEREMESHRLNIWLKPRQMMVSNLNCGKRLHRAIQAGAPGNHVYLALIVSKREDDAMELMRRIQFMYDNLPDWLKPAVKIRSKTELEFATGGKIICLPASATIGHTYTATDVFLDEWARLPFDYEIHAGIMPTIGAQGRIDGVSTPYGMFNVFAEIWNSQDTAWNKIELDWREHPERNEAWAMAEQEKICPSYPHDLSIWQQQYEKAFNVFTDKSIYPGFTGNHCVRNLKYERGETVYRGWDFGGHVAAVTFFQVADHQIRILKEIIVTDQKVSQAASVIVNPDNNIEDLAMTVIDRTRAWFGPDAICRDFCDPQGAHVSDMSRRSQRSRIDVLNSCGIWPEYRFSNIAEGVEIIRMRLRTRPDGSYGLVIDPDGAPVLTDGFRGGICRRPSPPNQPYPSGEEVRKDGWYEHVHDSFRYAIVGLFRTSETRAFTRHASTRRYDQLTGVPA